MRADRVRASARKRKPSEREWRRRASQTTTHGALAMARSTKRAFHHLIATSRGQRAADESTPSGHPLVSAPGPWSFVQLDLSAAPVATASQVPRTPDSSRLESESFLIRLKPEPEQGESELSASGRLHGPGGREPLWQGRMFNRLYRWVSPPGRRVPARPMPWRPWPLPRARFSLFRRTSCWCRWCWHSRDGLALCWHRYSRVGVRRRGRLCLGRLAVRDDRRLADPPLRLRRQGRDVRASFQHWGAWIILIKGLTPIPYKLVTIVSGLLGYRFRAVSSAVADHPRRPLLPPGRVAAAVRRADRGATREAVRRHPEGFLVVVALGFWIATHVI